LGGNRVFVKLTPGIRPILVIPVPIFLPLLSLGQKFSGGLGLFRIAGSGNILQRLGVGFADLGPI
jgi:hypothetical protein